jgi:hypothetical protein
MIFIHDTAYKTYLYFSKYRYFLKLGFTLQILQILYFVRTYVFIALVAQIVKLLLCPLN